MVWIPAILGLLIGATVSGGVVGMSMLVREGIVVAGARKTATDAGIVTCNARVGQIEAAHNKAVEDAANAAVAATAGISDPIARDDLVALCKASASCRDRGNL